MSRRPGIGRLVVASALVAALALVDRAVAGDTRPGMRAYVDPRTGRLATEAPPGAPAPPTPAAESRSSAGLREVPAPGGGMMIDLQGRFQSPLVATVEPDGSIRVHHGTSGE